MLINVEPTHVSPHLINVIDRPKSGTSHTEGPVKISGWVYETLNQPVKLAIKSDNDISFYDLTVRRVDVVDHLKNQGHKEDISAVLGFSVDQPLDKDVEIGFSTSGNTEWLYKIKAEDNKVLTASAAPVDGPKKNKTRKSRTPKTSAKKN